MFPPKKIAPSRKDHRGRKQRHNDSIEIIWDDGVCMEGILFGTQECNGYKYPKQLGSFPKYSDLGKYMRNRLKVADGQPIRRIHLEKYGRDNIGITLLSEGIYKFDFSINI